MIDQQMIRAMLVNEQESRSEHPAQAQDQATLPEASDFQTLVMVRFDRSANAANELANASSDTVKTHEQVLVD